ncbi:hypothetical protein CONCODRAFT_3615 [Conidiobolus coronatus NRRL 28638]|uniref:Peptide N-acetyl-beta-D-glucosaminyl asparaginase amidase A N-terminal domain-containing protein n=1 Tax=Conidiobolus coronatus (strain ATCC 28846 / CBS 209.66 / NRRL 28638) TaxID=796925 RepID=A0A137PEE6_CONC2|nr:hypothetical protein CONCODRAFT_3615 [Conidiobolus coronatus NRRL 28638]|eukprot:KXN73384.1 hypothetical protein CONCODRAFT_3615 [Conidiobolus coronatus NRRL 28638]
MKLNLVFSISQLNFIVEANKRQYLYRKYVYSGGIYIDDSLSTINESNNKTGYNYESPFELAIVPIARSGSKPDCEINLMHYEFGNSYAVLSWKGYSKGTQFDRIAAVTAEPTREWFSWEFSVDVTRYRSLLNKDRALTVSLNNIVSEIYTGPYLIDIKLEIYLDKRSPYQKPDSVYKRPDDDIIGISQFRKNNKPWFTMESNKTVNFKLPQVPSNTQRALLEVFVTGNGKEEFWQFNTHDDFAVANDLLRYVPLRELQVSVNVFTGGLSPSLWRPISGIGSFSTDPIRFELSQFLGDLIKNPNREIELLNNEDDIGENSGMTSFNSLNFQSVLIEDGKIRLETARKLVFEHGLKPQICYENQYGVRELHKELFKSKWKLYGQTEYQAFKPSGFLVNATMTVEGKFGRRPDMPTEIDGASDSTVNYWSKLDTQEECFKRSVKTEDGCTTQDRKPPKLLRIFYNLTKTNKLGFNSEIYELHINIH